MVLHVNIIKLDQMQFLSLLGSTLTRNLWNTSNQSEFMVDDKLEDLGTNIDLSTCLEFIGKGFEFLFPVHSLERRKGKGANSQKNGVWIANVNILVNSY